MSMQKKSKEIMERRLFLVMIIHIYINNIELIIFYFLLLFQLIKVKGEVTELGLNFNPKYRF